MELEVFLPLQEKKELLSEKTEPAPKNTILVEVSCENYVHFEIIIYIIYKKVFSECLFCMAYFLVEKWLRALP